MRVFAGKVPGGYRLAGNIATALGSVTRKYHRDYPRISPIPERIIPRARRLGDPDYVTCIFFDMVLHNKIFLVKTCIPRNFS
jgi:hypothetical protein